MADLIHHLEKLFDRFIYIFYPSYMNIKQNYSAYWDAFKPFLNSLPNEDIVKILNNYFRIKESILPIQEKYILVQELITTTKQKYIKLKTSSPKQSYVLED